MYKTEQKSFAKAVLKRGGINVFKKDIKSCEIHYMANVKHKTGDGLEDDVMSHREIINIEMNDGTGYEVLRETVDHDGNFSTVSAKWIVKDIRKR